MLVRVLFLFFFISPVAALAEAPKSDVFGEICNQFLKSLTFNLDRPPGARRFYREYREVVERTGVKGAPELSGDYLFKSSREWFRLGDPAYHLTVLQYPVPEGALEALDLALKNKMTAEGVRKIITKTGWKSSRKAVLDWTADLLDHPKFRDPAVLEAMVDAYRKTTGIVRGKTRYFTGIPVIPQPQAGTVRMYKGSNFYRGPSLSQSQSILPSEKVRDGGEFFLDQSEANQHSVRAEAFHPDGVSVSLDKTVILSYGSHIRVYDVPKEVASQLPSGAPELRERVFRYSVPERFRVMTIPKATYLEALKREISNTSPFSRRMNFSGGTLDGGRLIEVLKQETDLVLLRGRTLSLTGIYSERAGVMEGYTIERHTLLGLDQLASQEKFFAWHEIHAPPNLDVKKAVKTAFALHDSGKPLAIELGNQSMHGEISVEILTQVMNRAGYSKAEVDLARALVGNDAIGRMIQGRITPQEAFEQLVEISSHTNLEPKEFFKLQSLFYISDASAYPDLRVVHFRTGEAGLVPVSDRFQVLRNLFEHYVSE